MDTATSGWGGQVASFWTILTIKFVEQTDSKVLLFLCVVISRCFGLLSSEHCLNNILDTKTKSGTKTKPLILTWQQNKIA